MDFGNIFVFLSIIQAALLIILLTNKKKVQFPTQYLIFLLLGLLYFQIEFLLVRNAAQLPTKTLLLTPHGGWLMMGPLLYFFIKNFYEKIETRQLIIHLLPFLLIAIVLPILITEPVPRRGYHYGMLSVLAYSQLGLTAANAFYAVIFFLQFIHLGFYIELSYRYNKKKRPLNHTSFIKRFLGFSVVTYIACLIFYTVLLASSFYSREWDYFLILPTAIFIYFITYLLLSSPEWWRSDVKLKNCKKYERSEIPQTAISSIMSQLEQSIITQKLFLDPELSLNSLADSLEVSRHNLSQAINRDRHLSFNDYINQFRVEEAKLLIQKYKGKRTILSIAYEAGFNNKATFNKYFKKMTGVTPSGYEKGLGKR